MSPPTCVISIGIAAVIGGCSGDRSPDPSGRAVDPSKHTMSARPTMRYAPPPDRFVQSSLLSFESPYDTAFVDARNVQLAVDPESARNHAMLASSATIKLGALVRGREFPGPWDLIGFRVRSAAAVDGSVRVARSGDDGANSSVNRAAKFTTASGEWKTLWFDLASLGLSASPTTGASVAATSDDLALVIKTDGVVMIDDVAIAQSRTVVSDSIVPKSSERWQVRRAGLEWQAAFGTETVLRLPALPFIADGYRVAEAGPTRVLFETADESKTLSIDRTGRLIENGRARIDPAVMKHAKAVAENASPAVVEVVGDDGGRVERSLPGDRDNDGYDECRGCYSVRASGDRVTVRLTRQHSTVRWPVIEVYDLPPGPVNVWLEGQTVPSPVRLSDGRAIVELPIDLERPVEVQISVR